MQTKCLSQNLKVRENLGGLGVDVGIILQWILEKQDVHWIHLAQDRDRWRAPVNTVMNLRDR